MKIKNFRAKSGFPYVLSKAFFVGLLASTWVVQAAGLGKLTVSSYLGQPLNAEIALESVADKEIDTLAARLASPKIFQKTGINLAPYHATLAVVVEKRTDGHAYIRVTSSQAINEPFLKLLIELNSSSGRMLREYNVLLDPAGSQKPAASPVVQPAVDKANVSTGIVASEAQASAKAEQKSSPLQEKTQIQAGNTYGPVMKGDTLSRIARQVSPDGVNLNQMLVALYRANRDAFLVKNMNLLKVGVILRIPDESEISAITVKEASHQVAIQKESWNDYRQRVAEMSGETSKNDTLKQSRTGKITSAYEDSSATGANKSEEVLILSKGELLDDNQTSAKHIEGKAAQNYLHMMEEDAIAKERALHEANERVVILEQNVAKLQRLLELKGSSTDNKNLIEQDQIQTKPELQPVPVTVEQDEKAVESPEIAIQTAEKSTLPVTIPVQPVAPKSSVKSHQPVMPESEESDSVDNLFGFVEENSELVAGGLAALLITALGISVIRRKKAQTEEMEMDGDVDDYSEKEADLANTGIIETVSSDRKNLESGSGFVAQEIAGSSVFTGFELAERHTGVDSGSFFENQPDDKDKENSFFSTDSINQVQEEDSSPLNELDYEIRVSSSELGEPVHKLDVTIETEVAGKSEDSDINEGWIFTAPDINLESESDSEQKQENMEEIISDHDEHQFEFDLDLPSETESIKESDLANDLSNLSTSLAKIDLTLGEEPETKPETKPQPRNEYTEAEEMQWQEVATKLDLAKAYLEMDDKEGAREILEEVLREGDEEQQATARSMLDQAN